MIKFLLDAGAAAGAAAAAATDGGTTEAAAATGGGLTSFLPLIIMVIAFYLLLMRPQKKREKQTQEMRNRLEIGDEIVTSGGVVGRVVSIAEDSLLIETGSANTKMRIAKWAVQANNSNLKAQQDEAAKKALEKNNGEAPKRKGLFGRKSEEE